MFSFLGTCTLLTLALSLARLGLQACLLRMEPVGSFVGRITTAQNLLDRKAEKQYNDWELVKREQTLFSSKV